MEDRQRRVSSAIIGLMGHLGKPRIRLRKKSLPKPRMERGWVVSKCGGRGRVAVLQPQTKTNSAPNHRVTY